MKSRHRFSRTTLRIATCILILASPVFAPADDAAPTAVVETYLGKMQIGKMEIRFFPEQAPEHVKNFIKLANKKFYDGTIFHRIIPGFMIQGGDPLTKDEKNKGSFGTGGPGYNIKAEFNDIPHKRGILSMARAADPDSAGSQFFIMVKDAKHLDGKYTVFGEVVQGIEVADKIVSQARDERNNPLVRIEIKVRIIDNSEHKASQ